MAILSHAQVKSSLYPLFGALLNAPQSQVLVDETYELVPSAQWLKDIADGEPTLNNSLYQSRVYDCDDYAMILKTVMAYKAKAAGLTSPYATGMIMTNKHAFNIGIDANRQVFILNTQSDARNFSSIATQAEATAFLELSSTNKIVLIYF